MTHDFLSLLNDGLKITTSFSTGAGSRRVGWQRNKGRSPTLTDLNTAREQNIEQIPPDIHL